MTDSGFTIDVDQIDVRSGCDEVVNPVAQQGEAAVPGGAHEHDVVPLAGPIRRVDRRIDGSLVVD